MCFLGAYGILYHWSYDYYHQSVIPHNECCVVGRVAPGEPLPLEFAFVNATPIQETIHITVSYSIIDPSGTVILTGLDTVDVQTLTAPFIYTVHIPAYFNTGKYGMDIGVSYGTEISPHLSHVQFSVEKKILGFYIYDWIGAIPIVGVPVGIGIFMFIRKKTRNHGSG